MWRKADRHVDGREVDGETKKERNGRSHSVHRCVLVLRLLWVQSLAQAQLPAQILTVSDRWQLAGPR